MARFSSILFWLSLIAWISALVTVAVAASFAFAILPDLIISMDEYRSYETSEHGSLAAGMVMEPMFAFTDLVQIGAAVMLVLSIIGLAATKRFPLRSIANIIRLACVVIAVGMLAFRVVVTAPHVNEHLRAYWAAAKAGETQQAHREHQAFIGHHESMRLWFGVTFVLLMVTAGISAAISLPPAAGHHLRKVELQEPRLLGKS